MGDHNKLIRHGSDASLADSARGGGFDSAMSVADGKWYQILVL